MAADAIRATAEGFNEMRGRVPVLTRIHVQYVLQVPSGAPEDKVSRALETHVSKCPTAQSIKNSVEITWTADIVEAD
jgi:uncharacterized OsmC-like protein